jgi:hypothetical protein
MELKRQFQISALAVVILVLLRIAIGWHFLHEGVWKFGEADFSAEPYLRQARGPFANGYRRLIPDFYGEERLTLQPRPTQGSSECGEPAAQGIRSDVMGGQV